MPTPEQLARQRIDQLLQAAGWVVQDLRAFNLGAGMGVAIREFQTSSGPADYVLFVDRKAVGIIEAKPEGTTLRGVHEQTARYTTSFPENIPHVTLPLPFCYESTGTETMFTDLRDHDYRSRRVFAFHKPETLLEWVRQPEPLRNRLQQMPELITEGLWEAQIEAIRNLEKSFAENRPRALIQMATGSGKTFTAVSFVYRLIKFAGAKRVLFLVDRNNLGKQALREFQSYATPDDGRKFNELYNVQRLASNVIDPVSKVCITTIQRLYSMLRGEQEYQEESEELSLFELGLRGDEDPKIVRYNPELPIETFDFIITDECHRSIYHLWRQVLEYYDAFIVGLTATPSKYTLGFFDQNLVTEYSHERAVADGVNVGYDVYRIRTRITQEGSRVEAEQFVDMRDKKSRAERWAVELDADLEYAAPQLDVDVVAPDQIRTVVRTFKERLASEIFPGRREVPKTLVFAKDDSHAEDIVEIMRQEFGKGNEFCKKITYRSSENTEELIASFRNSYNPRIAVTVDMIATGTDVKPLECLLFMRMIKSQGYFEQMKGRGTRVISATDLEAVTPDAGQKTHFVIVDAVGVCEEDKTDTRPLERKPYLPFDKLMERVALGIRDADTLSSLANRLARLDCELTPRDREEIEQASGGTAIKTLIHQLLDAVDPDVQIQVASEMFGVEAPNVEQIEQATESLVIKACAPFDSGELRQALNTLARRNEQVIDIVSRDELRISGFDEEAKEKAQQKVQTFRQFIEENKNELTALQILYSQPYGARELTYQAVKELAEAIRKPPYHLTTEELWRAYEQLHRSKVRGAGTQRLLTNIISLIRFALEKEDVLEPFPATVDERYRNWLVEQVEAGRQFSTEQLEWLEMIKDHIATSVTIEMEDFEDVPFNQKGGAIKVYQLFGDELNSILQNVSRVLVA
jgi:type I restriction enzyme, R subunit